VDIKVPPNTSAMLILPEKVEEIEVGSGRYHYEYATETDLNIERFSKESTLGELVAEELGKQLFEQYIPGMLNSPMIQFAFDMTINELISKASEAEPVYEAVIQELNRNDKKIRK